MRNRVRTYFWVIASFVVFFVPQILFASQHNTGSNEPNTGSNMPNTGSNVPSLTNPLRFDSLTGFVEAALNIVRNLGFLVAVFFIIYAGFLFVTAQGDESKLTKAKQAFLWAVVGTAVLLGAWIFAKAIEGTIKAL